MASVLEICVIVLTLLVIRLTWQAFTDGYNVDTANVGTIDGPRGTDFGFSLSFDNSGPKGKPRMVIGAPKDKTILEGMDVITGSVYTCSEALETSVDCKKETEINVFPDHYRTHLQEGYSFAISVSKGGSKLVCAPFWKDRRYERTYAYTFMPGRCMVFFKNESGSFSKKDMPFYGQHYLKSGGYFYGLAAYGSSSDFYGDLVTVVGAPGHTRFEGAIAVIDYRQGKPRKSLTRLEYEDTLNTTAYGYLGYDVKFGQFCNPPTICLAAGAPNLYTVGVVRLYKWLNEEHLSNFQTIQGEETWSYFGSVICPADTDGDKLDELLVGAPYYTEHVGSQHDIGKVYVYKRKSISKYFYLYQKLDGKKIKYSRFGSAIQSVGDLNLDGYSDIVIGAPGEENGSGCIYLFLGSPSGLINAYSQRICVSQIDSVNFIKNGFGSTISGPAFQTDNPYPYFAVSAFPSDSILLFHAKPVLELKSALTNTPNPVDINGPCIGYDYDGPCTVLLFCLEFTIREEKQAENLKKDIYFQISIKIDSQIQSLASKRAFFVTENEELVDSIVEKSVSVSKGKNKCLDKQIIIKKITFENDCGSDNVCYVDLKVESHIIGLDLKKKEKPYIVYGFTEDVSVHIEVSNTKESCYWTEIRVKLSQPLVLSKFFSGKVRQCQAETDVSNSAGTTIVCKYSQPLVLNNPISVLLTFDTENLAEDKQKLSISVEANAVDKKHNPEMHPRNNIVSLILDIFIAADIDIYGVATPKEMIINNAKNIFHKSSQDTDKKYDFSEQDTTNTIELNHKVLIQNKGPSFLPTTKVYSFIPVFLPDESRLVTSSILKLITGNNMIDCSKPVPRQKTPDMTGSTTAAPISSEMMESPKNEKVDHSTIYTLSCHETPALCLTFVCDIPSTIMPRGHVELNITLTLDRDNIPLPEGFSTFQLEVKTVLEQPSHKLFKPWNDTSLQQPQTVTQTVFNLYESGGKVNIWIIIGSVTAGLVVIAVIVVIIWKLGFFERKRHFQVNKWRTESQRSRRSKS